MRIERWLRWAFRTTLLARLLYPFYDSPLNHLFSDPLRHWHNGLHFLHPDMMVASDPFLYQLWLFILQEFAHGSPAVILIGCGSLCAAMPYGWYRTLMELVPERWALIGALIIALTPSFIAIYAYFMTETLLLTLTGFAFWFTFRAQQKQTIGAFAFACTLWLCALFTRVIAAPMALGCLLFLWLPQPRKPAKALLVIAVFLGLMIPAGLHAQIGLHYFAPFGNLYYNEIYARSGKQEISVRFGTRTWIFGSPTLYNPTFYPFSSWTTGRSGIFEIVINPALGRASWISERDRAVRGSPFPRWKGTWENGLFLLFAQSWPDNNRNTFSGWLSVWTRWLWPPIFATVAYGAIKSRFHGREWLLPACALGMLLLLVLQREGIMEARYRKPIEPIFLTAIVVMIRRYAAERPFKDHFNGTYRKKRRYLHRPRKMPC
jgi:Dolichyl-phosphate-mannose-protein mannosyltransferase